MLKTLLRNLSVAISDIQERDLGAAFLRGAREVYPLASIVYVGLNIPIRHAGPVRFVHCTYGDDWALHATSNESANLDELGLGSLFKVRAESTKGFPWVECPALGEREFGIPLTNHHGESAALVVRTEGRLDPWLEEETAIAHEVRALGQYFHQHMLRIFGRANERAMAISDREVACLKWMAAGKTAWEVGTILGISERTVRFHLNAAREKLQCTTTTQAVARAVSEQLFVI